MVDGNGDDERKTKYFILSIFICVFAGSFQERFWKFGSFQIFLLKIPKSDESGENRDLSNFWIHRIVWSPEIFDLSNCSVHRIVRFLESVDLPIFLVHRILKTEKKYGYNISSVNGVAEFVKERLYPYNGTEQVLLDGIALECFNIEGQGSKDWSVLNFIYWQKLDWTGCPNWSMEPCQRLRCLY